MTPAVSAAIAGLQPVTKGGQLVARCPAHDDRAPSLNITEKDGKTLLRCHAGCDTRDVVAALGLTMADLFDDTADGPRRQEVAAYDYHDADGRLVYQAVRYEPKGFAQRRPLGGEWVYDLAGVARVPYRLPSILTAGDVVIVEGEKDADRLTALGFTATTNAGGAGKWRAEWGPIFAGRRVTILPDNDELPGLPPKGDVSDWLAGHEPDDLRALLDERHALGYERLGDIPVDEDQPMALEPFVLDEGPAIYFGDGGCGKSTLALVLSASFASGQELVPDAVPSVTGPVMWLDYEAQRRTTAKRLHLLGLSSVPILYVPGTRPISEDIERLSAIARYEGVGLVVVDSVVLAVGGAVSPKDPESPTMYANAVAAIAPRSIGLAHVVKSVEDDGRKPFGSGFWHNIARLTWHLKRDEDEQGHVIRLTCRKRTNGEQFAPRTLTIEWGDGLRVVEGPAMSTVAAHIRDILLAEPDLTAAAISVRMRDRGQERSVSHIHNELKRGGGLFERSPGPNGALWRVVGDEL